MWVCGERDHRGTVPGKPAIPDNQTLAKLVSYTDKFLELCRRNKHHLHIVRVGNSFRPARKSALPVIAAVRPSWLSTLGNEAFLLCSGHGSYGVTLGMGSGK